MSQQRSRQLGPDSPNTGGGDANDMAQAALKAAMDAVAGLQDDVNTAAQPAAAGPATQPTPAAVASTPPPGSAPFALPKFTPNLTPQQARAIDLLSDVSLNVKIELGRTRMLVEDVLRLSDGAVVELDKLAGDPVDIFVNNRPIARGEVLVLNDAFCVRINEIVQSVSEADLRAAASKAG